MNPLPDRKLLVATRNPGKLREFRQLLCDIPFEVISLQDVGIKEEIPETGHSFAENARLKAQAYGKLSGLITLADDSGLEVDGLDGAPGVESARYGGPGLSDEDRVRLLLENLKHVPWGDRSGRFKCAIAVIGLSEDMEIVTGEVEGIIQYEPKGDNGFGYDPVFYIPRLGKTSAELPMDEKNSLSHRGKAARKAAAVLKSWLEAEAAQR